MSSGPGTILHDDETGTGTNTCSAANSAANRPTNRPGLLLSHHYPPLVSFESTGGIVGVGGGMTPPIAAPPGARNAAGPA